MNMVIAMGKTKTFEKLSGKDLGQHSLEYIQHYSGVNAHWNTIDQHNRIIQITKA